MMMTDDVSDFNLYHVYLHEHICISWDSNGMAWHGTALCIIYPSFEVDAFKFHAPISDTHTSLE